MHAAALGHALAALRYGSPPSSRDCGTIRCECLHGCRLRCPRGRRLLCACCKTPVGPCCGIRWPGQWAGEAEETSVTGVCHACIGESPARPCQCEAPPSDFPSMSSAEMMHVQSVLQQAAARSADMIWRDLNDEVLQARGLREEASAGTPVASVAATQPSRVAAWLYLGDLKDVQELVAGGLCECGFAGILSLCHEKMHLVRGVNRFGQLQGPGPVHQVVAASDSMGFDMIGHALPAAMHFARPFFRSRAPLLVHCCGGLNRSAFIVAALLVLLEDMPLTDALRAIAASRGRVLTNRSFRAQLLDIAARTGRVQ